MRDIRRTDLRSLHRQELGSRFRRLVDGDDAQLYSLRKRRRGQLEAHLRVLGRLLGVVRDEEDGPAGLSAGNGQEWQVARWQEARAAGAEGRPQPAPSAPQTAPSRRCSQVTMSPSGANFLHSAAGVASHYLVLEGLVALDQRDRPRLGMHRSQGPQQERATAATASATHGRLTNLRLGGGGISK